MKEFIDKWSNWWILNPKREQLDYAFVRELNELIEREVALQQKAVSGSLPIFKCKCGYETSDSIAWCVHADCCSSDDR